jgi:hypothetical protein
MQTQQHKSQLYNIAVWQIMGPKTVPVAVQRSQCWHKSCKRATFCHTRCQQAAKTECPDAGRPAEQHAIVSHQVDWLSSTGFPLLHRQLSSYPAAVPAVSCPTKKAAVLSARGNTAVAPCRTPVHQATPSAQRSHTADDMYSAHQHRDTGCPHQGSRVKTQESCMCG